MSSPSAEALALVALLPDAAKYQQALQNLIDKTTAADAAVANLVAKEKFAADSAANKIAACEAVVASLTGQADELRATQAATEAKLASREKEVAEREAAVTDREKKSADEIARALQEHASRKSELKQRQSVLDADFHRRLEDLRGVENKLRDRHSVLRDLVTETRARLAAAS